jgi:hypothetical protein
VHVGFVKNGSKINESGLDRPMKEKNGHAPTPIGAKLEPDPNPKVLLPCQDPVAAASTPMMGPL